MERRLLWLRLLIITFARLIWKLFLSFLLLQLLFIILVMLSFFYLHAHLDPGDRSCVVTNDLNNPTLFCRLSEGDDPLGFDMPLVEVLISVISKDGILTNLACKSKDNMVLQGDWLNDDNFSYGGEGFIEDALTSQDNWLWDFCGFDGVGFQHASLDGHGLLATMVAMLLARSLLLSSLGRAKRGNQNTGQKGSSCRLY
ncbi:uncharacterized protein LOC110098423 isoform X1 [Dendrobium catenatum]|uniref:uncharacterized protein LOC110098423 isoform X1 n=1 Tax=Dendrobium catenatum TaxID=906689 RepID=UPI00109EF17E|nr:uncharacterized protein LOC110098423 isoform X1 [Dendrobium catenatum]